MKQIERNILGLVLLLAVFIAVSCDSASPLGPEQPEPREKIPVLAKTIDTDGDLIQTGVITFDGGSFQDSIVTRAGLYDRDSEKRDVDIDVTGSAEGYEPVDADTTINLKSAAEAILVLKKKEDKPEGPGKVTLVKKSECVDGDDGFIVVKSENGGIAKLRENGEVIQNKGEVAPGEKVRFDGLTAGDYTPTFTKNGDTKSIEVSLGACAEKPSPGTPEIDKPTCSDPSTANGVVTGTIPNGYDWVEIQQNGDRINDLRITSDNPTKNQKFRFENVPAGDFDVVAGLNDKTGKNDVSVPECAEKPAPGKIYVTDLDCNDNNKVYFRAEVENGYERYVLDIPSTGEIVKKGDGFTPSGRQVIEFDDLEDNVEYRLKVFRNEKPSDTRFEKKERCEPANKAPTARYTHKVDGKTASYDGSESFDADGEIVEWAWDFTNDGTIDVRQSDPQINHTFNDYSSERTRLVVTDNDGATDEYIDDVHPEEPQGPGNVTAEDIRCKDYDGKVTIKTENPADYVRIFNANGEQIREKPGPATSFQFSGLPDGTLTGEVEANGKTNTVEFTIDCDKELSSWYSHEFNGGYDETVWVSGHKNRLHDIIAAFGEMRPILTDKDPSGDVEIEVFFETPYPERGQFALEIYWDKDGNESFTTPIYRTDLTNRTSATIKVPAEVFAGHSKDPAGFRVIHVDAINNNTPEGPDKVLFASKDEMEAKFIVYWRILVDSGSYNSTSAMNQTLKGIDWITDDKGERQKNGDNLNL